MLKDANKKRRAGKTRHKIVSFTACSVDGRPGFWRVKYSNGVVHTIKGNRSHARQQANAAIARWEQFDKWCIGFPAKACIRKM